MIKLPRDLMIDILDSAAVVEDSIVDTSRWSICHDLVFKHDGKLYRTYYRVGATEMQDESPWEYDTFVECQEVVPVQVTVTKYVNA